MIDEAGVERILTKLRNTPKTDLGRIEKLDHQLLLHELRLCERQFSMRSDRRLRLTKPGLRKLRSLKDLLEDPDLPWRLLDAEDAFATLVSKLRGYLSGPLTPLNANPTELLVGQDLPFAWRRFFGQRPRMSRNPRSNKFYETPFLVFVRAVMAEMGLPPFSNGTIATCLRDHGRRRLERT
jgi:hypothetical protein